ncbi:MAG: hypothetical protein D6788_03055, partial [Planctomycetota bacterium]
MKPWGIQARAIVVYTSLLVLAAVPLVGGLTWQSYREMIGRERDNALLYAQAVAFNAEPGLLVGD